MMILYSKEGAETFFSTVAKVDMAKITIKMFADQLITDEDLVALCSGGTFTGSYRYNAQWRHNNIQAWYLAYVGCGRYISHC